MEEFVTLSYGNFVILGEWAQEFTQCTGCSNWVADRTPWGQIFLNEWKREHPELGHHPQAGVRPFLIGASAVQCGFHEEKRTSKVLSKITGRGSQR